MIAKTCSLQGRISDCQTFSPRDWNNTFTAGSSCNKEAYISRWGSEVGDNKRGWHAAVRNPNTDQIRQKIGGMFHSYILSCNVQSMYLFWGCFHLLCMIKIEKKSSYLPENES